MADGDGVEDDVARGRGKALLAAEDGALGGGAAPAFPGLPPGGFEAEEDSLGIGRATTSSVVTSIIVIIVADTLMARMFNMIFYGSAV